MLPISKCFYTLFQYQQTMCVFWYTPHLLRFSETTQELPTDLALNNYRSTQPEAGKSVWSFSIGNDRNRKYWWMDCALKQIPNKNDNILNLKITPVWKKENHRPNLLHFWVPCYFFRVRWGFHRLFRTSSISIRSASVHLNVHGCLTRETLFCW